MKDVVRAFGRCRKDTDFYRLQIQLENRLSPSEFARLAHERQRLPEPARAWLDRLAAMQFGEYPVPRSFARRDLGEHVRFYTGAAKGDAPRDLLVAFCGGAQRLMVPVSVALQHMDDTRFDVVVATDPRRLAFAAGIKGYARSFEAMLARLKREVEPGHYATVRTLGTSQGGSAALRAGLCVGAERAVAVGGRAHPENLSNAPPAADTVVFCVHGTENEPDREGALRLVEALGGRTVAIPGIGSHNILHEILKQGWLGEFFETVLTGEPSETLASSRTAISVAGPERATH